MMNKKKKYILFTEIIIYSLYTINNHQNGFMKINSYNWILKTYIRKMFYMWKDVIIVCYY